MLPILCYHQVGPSASCGRRLSVEPETLESHVRHFCRRGLRFARAGDLESGIPRGCICLTFDDAYESALAHAVPILQKQGVWATFYAVPGRIGGVSDWDVGHEAALAGWDTLLAAQSAGNEIGNHTLNHPDLTMLGMDAQAQEIEQAEDLMIEHGLDARSLCYPYGKFNADTLTAVEREGYKVGLALGRRPARPGDDLRCLPRIVVSHSDRLPKLLYRIHIRPKLPTFKGRPHYVS